MDWLLPPLAKLLPLLYAVLALWIKAFDKDDRLRNPGKFMVVGIVMSGLFVYCVSELEGKSRQTASEVERAKQTFKEALIRDSISPRDILLIVTARHTPETFESAKELKPLAQQTFAFLDIGGKLKLSAAQTSHSMFDLSRDEHGLSTEFVGLPADLTALSDWAGLKIDVLMGWSEKAKVPKETRCILYLKGRVVATAPMEVLKSKFGTVGGVATLTIDPVRVLARPALQVPVIYLPPYVRRFRYLAWGFFAGAIISACWAVQRQLSRKREDPTDRV